MRQSGILMHITSLPGAYGIGTMGKQAYEFVDFLQKAGQSYWQILPLTPTGYGDSPYQSCSAFAGNHYLIDPDTLIRQGLLTQQEADSFTWCQRQDKVDFGMIHAGKLSLLELAYRRFEATEAFDAFCRENIHWLSDFALYMALKEHTGGKAWYEWDEPLRRRNTDAVWQARKNLRQRIRFYSFVQYLFYEQWNQLKNYAHKKGIRIIGDVPIYVPLDSADVWANPELFQLDKDLRPTAVAGCPPDAFSEDGQLWGNPLYRWEEMKTDGYSWWLRRLSAAQKLYDTVRLDHFRGFESFWAIPYGDETAKNGRWVKGPGMDFISAVKSGLPKLELIAEDLGFLTEDVLSLLKQSGFPGMKVLGFAFDSREPSAYLPHNCVPNAVCYTGTHDNMTTRQWLETASRDVLTYATDYMHLTKQEGLVWGVIRTAMSTVCDLCIVPMQDYLELGGEARMNFPGTLSDSNWTWRLKDAIIDDILAGRIRDLTQLYHRLGNQIKAAVPACEIGMENHDDEL